MIDYFANYHPTVNFLYFSLVIGFSMFFMHPVCLLISAVSAFLYSVCLNKKKALVFNFKYLLPMLLLTALINPAFNHRGMTILTYLPSGNPLTLESIVYGLAAATMMVSVIGWFSCYNAVMTSDKFIYLFGRVIPVFSLFLAMVLRFVPLFKHRLKEVSNAQKCIGRDMSNGKLIEKIKNGIGIFSIMMTWMLENAIHTADSMKSRGYGLPGRTAFSIFHFSSRDKFALLFLVMTGGYILLGSFYGALYYRYFPSIRGNEYTPFNISTMIAYFLLCIFPLILNGLEGLKWKSLKSKI